MNLYQMLMRQMGLRTDGGLPKARDVHHVLDCTLEDVYNGTDKSLSITRISSPRGTRQPDVKVVHVERGMDHESKIVFRDDGDYIPGQCEPGKRIVVLRVETHPRFRRQLTPPPPSPRFSFLCLSLSLSLARSLSLSLARSLAHARALSLLVARSLYLAPFSFFPSLTPSLPHTPAHTHAWRAQICICIHTHTHPHTHTHTHRKGTDLQVEVHISLLDCLRGGATVRLCVCARACLLA